MNLYECTLHSLFYISLFSQIEAAHLLKYSKNQVFLRYFHVFSMKDEASFSNKTPHHTLHPLLLSGSAIATSLAHLSVLVRTALRIAAPLVCSATSYFNLITNGLKNLFCSVPFDQFIRGKLDSPIITGLFRVFLPL